MENVQSAKMISVNTETDVAKLENENQQEHERSTGMDATEEDDTMVHLTLQDITEELGPQEPHPRGIPTVKFLDDINLYVQSFAPKVITAELLIGAYTQLHTKYKLSESSLLRKQEHLKQKVPELEKSLSLVQSLIEKQELGVTDGIVRYNFVDSIYAKASIDYSVGTVYLWLGANVMLEYTYAEAMQFLQNNYSRAQNELCNVNTDLAFIRDQIVTSEVNISRIYNWDVRRKRGMKKK